MSAAPEFTGPVKPFCPCDADRPQDCNPEDWPGAHEHRDCARCGRPDYQHNGLRYCLPVPKGSPS